MNQFGRVAAYLSSLLWKLPLMLEYFRSPAVDFDVDVLWFHMFSSAHFVEPFCNICF